jgi:hypothetical protein
MERHITKPTAVYNVRKNSINPLPSFQ